jgi:hypothetical protein
MIFYLSGPEPSKVFCFTKRKTIMKEDHYKAPNMQVLLSDGLKRELRDFWEERPLVLVFLRHFG